MIYNRYSRKLLLNIRSFIYFLISFSIHSFICLFIWTARELEKERIQFCKQRLTRHCLCSRTVCACIEQWPIADPCSVFQCIALKTTHDAYSIELTIKISTKRLAFYGLEVKMKAIALKTITDIFESKYKKNCINSK